MVSLNLDHFPLVLIEHFWLLGFILGKVVALFKL
jgi:hypothetical protein